MATDSRHERLWHALNDLHEQEKIPECIKQGRTNLFDPSMPLYWRIRTLCTLVVVEDVESGWAKADVSWKNIVSEMMVILTEILSGGETSLKTFIAISRKIKALIRLG
jgi:hypothetical protein